MTDPPPPLDGTIAHRAPALLERRDLRWLAVALIVAVAVRVAWVLYVDVDPNNGPLNDSVFYHNAAHLLADGKGYVMPLVWHEGSIIIEKSGEPTAQWPPGYPAVLAVVYKLFGWHLLPAKLLNVAFAAITVTLTYIVAKRLFGPKVAGVSALALAVFPGQVYFSTLLMTESLFAMLFMLTFVLVLVWTLEREPRWWQLMLIGVTVGYSALVRAEGLLLALIMIALWFFVLRSRRKLLRYVLLLGGGIALVLLPWTVRNAIELDKFVLVRDNAGWALSAGLDPEFKEENLEDPYLAFNPPQPPLGDVLSHWATHPWELPSFAALKLRILYKNDEEGIFLVQTVEAYLSERGADGWSTLANVYFFSLGALALVGGAVLSLLSRRRDRIALVWFGVGWSLMFVAFIPTTRYHYPVEPLIAILGSATVVAVWDATLGRVRFPRSRLPSERDRARSASSGASVLRR